MISICTDLPNASVPVGCKAYDEHAAVVKYDPENPTDCIEIGSLENCTADSSGECGLQGVATGDGNSVTLTYTYQYGCINTFTMFLKPGDSASPDAITNYECAYNSTWAALPEPPAPPTALFVCGGCEQLMRVFVGEEGSWLV